VCYKFSATRAFSGARALLATSRTLGFLARWQLRALFLATSRAFLARRDEFSANQKAPGPEVREKQAETENTPFSARLGRDESERPI
jgi:hypothetical protein